MEYKIISAHSTGALALNVTNKLKEGWAPVGGLIFDPIKVKYLQAIIKTTKS